MAGDIRTYPPTGRRLGRLWAAGVTPASQALVGAVVIAVGALAVWASWPAIVAQAQGMMRQSLELAAGAVSAEQAAGLASALAWRAAGAVAALGLALVAVALAAHRLQLGPRGDETPGSDTAGGLPAASGLRLGAASTGDAAWLIAAGVVALMTAAVGGRAAMAQATGLVQADVPRLLDAAAGLAAAVGAPVLAALVGMGLLEWMMRRASFTSAAWMSRREMADELRLSEGHPLVRDERRRRARRRGSDA